MTVRKITAATAAIAMMAAPAVAQSGRASAPTESQSDLGGGSSVLLIAAIIAFGAAIFFLTDNDDETPTSA